MTGSFIFGSVGYYMLIYISGIEGIPQDLRMPLVTVTAISMAMAKVKIPPTNQINSMFRIEIIKLALPKILV